MTIRSVDEIRAVAKANNIGPTELAAACDPKLPVATTSRILSGKRTGHFDTIMRISAALDRITSTKPAPKRRRSTATSAQVVAS